MSTFKGGHHANTRNPFGYFERYGWCPDLYRIFETSYFGSQPFYVVHFRQEPFNVSPFKNVVKPRNSHSLSSIPHTSHTTDLEIGFVGRLLWIQLRFCIAHALDVCTVVCIDVCIDDCTITKPDRTKG
jgi:hypothetical protein